VIISVTAVLSIFQRLAEVLSLTTMIFGLLAVFVSSLAVPSLLYPDTWVIVNHMAKQAIQRNNTREM